MRRLDPTLLLCCILLSTACAEDGNRMPELAQTVLEKAETFILYSLDPAASRGEEKPKDAFHGYAVLGQTEVKDADARAKLVEAFKKGVKENQGEVAMCFEPRHGIRVKKGETTVDFVICFECLQVHCYGGGKLPAGEGRPERADAGGEERAGFLVAASPQPAFDAALKAAGIKLAAKPGE
ncbi:MAG: hypothetical protein M5U26_27155 [Planctomycetota bacterium]|nr:hypothetical protein [Planctomycetota bacterium]